MKSEDQNRLKQLDDVIGQQQPAQGTSADLFAVVDFLESSASLRRALTDPASSAEARRALAGRLLAEKISAPAMGIVNEAVALKWRNGSVLAAAIERAAVSSLLRLAQADNVLDTVIAELVDFDSLLRAHDGLREAIRDTTYSVAARVSLIGSLVADRYQPISQALLNRAVEARERTFALTVAGYLRLAAELRNRKIARITVARPLEGDQQARLAKALIAQVGSAVDLQIEVDPAVLGGVKVTFADDQIDSTFASRLADAKRQLSTN